ncbi:MAG: trypsin-like peptidase domain-containing protein [Phormidium sp. BM_Day4_Bin.17]|nr:trypsin-like peptidase domain-containing protein [Phormidium sp. BM_Day4_Bin.17]
MVAPGYVLTCAHVVLQALGIREDNFTAHKTPPEDIITLDFLPNTDTISARIVLWEPYDIHHGDLAGLKLLSPPPETARPLPLISCSLQEIEFEPHVIFGFASESGGRTDAYRPHSNAVGGRFQFHKKDDPEDDTIEPGYSGAPVWNALRHGVVGMIATAEVSSTGESRSRANAIKEKSLHPLVQELFARSLYDRIQDNLTPAITPAVNRAIENAFLLCDTDGDRSKSNALRDRLLYLAQLPNRGWQQEERDIDRLTQFASFLMVFDDLPRSFSDEIKTWVRRRYFNFDALYVKADEYRKKYPVSSGTTEEYVVVQIKPREQTDTVQFYVSLWIIPDRNQANPLVPHTTLAQDELVTESTLIAALDKKLNDQHNLFKPFIHCFVPHSFLGCDLDTWETEDGFTLGGQFRFVMRTDISSSPDPQFDKTRWERYWQSLKDKQVWTKTVRETFVRTNCARKIVLLFKDLHGAEMAILENLASERVPSMFQNLAKRKALPVVTLWVRQNHLYDELDQMLDCRVMDLPQQVFEKRKKAMGEETGDLGYHLSLVWEDPNVIPPTWEPFDQNRC